MHLPNDDYLLRLCVENYFLKVSFTFNYNFIFYDFKTSLKSIFMKVGLSPFKKKFFLFASMKAF